MANRVKVVLTEWCPYCIKAKSLLEKLKVDFDIIDVTDNQELREQFKQKTGMRTVPMILIDDECIGGCDDLHELNDSGRLKDILGK